MPEYLVQKILRAIEKGVIPRICRERGIKGRKCAELIVAIIENRRKKAKEMRGGEETGTNMSGLYTEFPEEVEEDEDGLWLSVASPETKLVGRDGRLYSLDDVAHLLAVDDWKQVNKAHIDHNENDEYPIEIKDVKYDFKGGLYLKVNADDNIKQLLREGVLKPSIEIYAPGVEDNLIKYYKPVGLGLMLVGKPRHPLGGPSEVPETAVGGEKMTEEEGNPPKGEDEEKKPEGSEEENKPQEGNNEELSEEEKLKQELERLRQEREELLKKMEEAKNAREKSRMLEEALKQEYLKKLPEELQDRYKDKPLEEIKEAIDIVSAILPRFQQLEGFNWATTFWLWIRRLLLGLYWSV